MVKQLFDRLSYALIGFILGAVVGAILWYLYSFGLTGSYRFYLRGLPQIHADVFTWIKYVGGFFAIIGFVFKGGVGDLLGESTAEVYRSQYWRPPIPTTMLGIAISLAFVVAIVIWRTVS